MPTLEGGGLRPFVLVTTLCVVAALAVHPASGAGVAAVRPLTATCRFEAPEMRTDSEGITRVTVPACAPWVRTGLPVLPFRTLRLLLPPGYTATGCVARTTAPRVTLSGVWQIELGREPSAFAPTAVPQPDPASQPIPSPYPAVIAELASVQRMAGYDIAVIRVFPLQYTPASGHLDFSPEVTVEVALLPVPSSLIPPSPRLDEQQRVMTAVDNPSIIPSLNSPFPMTLGDPATNYLLITRSDLLPSFQPLIAQKQAAGLAVRTEVMESITNLYAGIDSAERLRTYIRHAYTTWGIQYVLLGGDIKTVPYRGVYARCSGVIWTLMPSDLYFACLDGSWNHDGDSLWGESTDGETGGDVDLLPEVCVGRAPVETAAEVTNFVARCLSAEQVPATHFRSILAGEFLNTAGAQGGDALDTLLPTLDNSHCPVAWLDDRPQLSAVWSATDALAALNRSPLLVAHFGHGTDYGYETMALRLIGEDLDALTNASPFLLYSTACNTGAFDNNFGMGDCIAEELVKRNQHGAFAVLANAREGWYDQAVEARYSGEFQKRFFDRLLSAEKTPIGVSHHLAKQDLLGTVETSGSNMPYRWCMFGLNLFGDPHAAVRVPLSLRFRATPTERIVRWNSWTNRTYAVYRSLDLVTEPGVCLASNVVATPPENVTTDAVPGISRAFYRVTTE